MVHMLAWVTKAIRVIKATKVTKGIKELMDYLLASGIKDTKVIKVTKDTKGIKDIRV